MPGLLPAEHPAAGAELLQHVAVPDPGGGDGDLGVAHRSVEAVVGHHRDDHPPAGEAPGALEVQRGERHQLVAVHDLPGAVHGEHAVAVAVEGEADGVAAREHVARELAHVGGAAAGVDVAPVGVLRDHRHVRAEAPEDLRRDAVGGAVGAVQQHVEPVEVELGEARVQLAQVVLPRAPQLAYAPDRPAAALLARLPRGGPRGAPAAVRVGAPTSGTLQLPLDLQLGLVGELEAVGAEELDAVVAVRVVRGGDHRREVEAVAGDQ